MYIKLFRDLDNVGSEKKKKQIMFAWFPVFFKRRIILLCLLSGYMLQTKQKLGIQILSENINFEGLCWGLFYTSWMCNAELPPSSGVKFRAVNRTLITVSYQETICLNNAMGKLCILLYSCQEKILISRFCLVPKEFCSLRVYLRCFMKVRWWEKWETVAWFSSSTAELSATQQTPDQ